MDYFRILSLLVGVVVLTNAKSLTKSSNRHALKSLLKLLKENKSDKLSYGGNLFGSAPGGYNLMNDLWNGGNDLFNGMFGSGSGDYGSSGWYGSGSGSGSGFGHINPFICNDGTEIPESWECDRIVDCAGGEDEHAGCPDYGSGSYGSGSYGSGSYGSGSYGSGSGSYGSGSENPFICNDGTEISAYWECDIIVDCAGGEDEHAGCPNYGSGSGSGYYGSGSYGSGSYGSGSGSYGSGSYGSGSGSGSYGSGSYGSGSYGSGSPGNYWGSGSGSGYSATGYWKKLTEMMKTPKSPAHIKKVMKAMVQFRQKNMQNMHK